MSKQHLTQIVKRILKPEQIANAILAAGYRLPTAKKTKRAKALAIRFVCNGDGTITDNLTGLIWIKDPSELGGVWGAPGNPSRMNYHDAVKNCKELKFAGHKDWRLPTIKELQSIIDYEKRGPAINTEFFPNTQSTWYWSITPVAGYSYSAWFVDFDNGGVDGSGKVDSDYGRPVRASQ